MAYSGFEAGQGSTQQILTQLQGKKIKWAWRDPARFERQLARRGFAALQKEVHRLGVKRCLALAHWKNPQRTQPRIWLRLLMAILADRLLILSFSQEIHNEDLIHFLNLITGQAEPERQWLTRAFSGLNEVFSYPLFGKIQALFEKQSLESQLDILLFSGSPVVDPEGLVEDCIYCEPLPAQQAQYLRTDLPELVNCNPEIYRPQFLAQVSASPMSRREFKQEDLRPWLEWAGASAAERFIQLLRRELSEEERQWLKEGDLFNLIRSPLLLGYLETHPLFDLIARLDQLYPWGAEAVPSEVQALRKQLAEAYFLPAGGERVQQSELEEQFRVIKESHCEVSIAAAPRAEETPPPSSLAESFWGIIERRCCLGRY